MLLHQPAWVSSLKIICIVNLAILVVDYEAYLLLFVGPSMCGVSVCVVSQETVRLYVIHCLLTI